MVYASAKILVDYAASHRLARKRIDEEIEELKKRQKKLELDSLNINCRLKAKLGPLYEYQEPSINEVRVEAYKLYEEDCRSKGLDAIPKHHEMGFDKAMEAFGGIAKECHLVKYMNDPDRIEIIKDHFRHKIWRLEYAGDQSQGCTGNSFGKFVFCGESSNETANIVRKSTFDGCEAISDEPQLPNSKRARSEKQPEQQ